MSQGPKRRFVVGEYPEGMSDGVESVFQDWLLDISELPGSYQFIPLINGTPEPRFSYSSVTCPGRLLGIYHKDGSAPCEVFERSADNEKWHSKYRASRNSEH